MQPSGMPLRHAGVRWPSPIAAVLFVAVVTACAPTPADPSQEPDAGGDPVGSWQLVAGTSNGEPVPVLDDHRVTLTIDGSRIGGTAACNGYGGRLSVVGGRLHIGELGQNGMACEPEVMELEAVYMDALHAVDAVRVEDEQLVLEGPQLELRFVRLQPPPTAELVDTVWLLEALVIDGVASEPMGEPAALEIRSDGTFSGSTGCRTFDGRWTEYGDEIMTPEWGMNDETCPPRIMGQDSHVVSVIGDGFVPSVEGDRLTISDAGGDALVYRAQE